MTTSDTLADLICDPVLAHEILFKRRHANDTPSFHQKLIRLMHSPHHARILALCFRGSGKSTIVEETVTLLALTSQVKNVLILAETWLRACDRLRAIRRELESNEWLIELFGPQPGTTWQESRIILSNSVAITASGAGQALRGTKHLEFRPDLAVIDDLENSETVATQEMRRKLSDWFFSDMLPALDPNARIIMLATPLHPQSLAVSLSRLPQWRTLTVPIEEPVDSNGQRRSSWPSRFPLTWIDEEKRTYQASGKSHRYAQEYDMVSRDPGSMLFAEEQFRFDPALVFDGEPAYIAIDPARTVKETSSTTGIVAASWIGRRLVVWEARALRITPAELVDLCFTLEARYRPLVLGIERDGLEEFLLQPLRHAQLHRAELLPIRALKAPRGKDEFIGRLQPLFAAGDIIFAGPKEAFGDALAQFLAFTPGGHSLRDVPNALAYIFELRSGVPVYEDATLGNVVETLQLRPGPLTLALHATPFGTAAVLFQYFSRVLAIYRDWVSEQDLGAVAPGIVEEARLHCGREPQLVVVPELMDGYTLASLRGRALIRAGGDRLAGRQVLRELLATQMQGVPRVLVARDASWVVRALLGGYVREIGEPEPKDSLYATLCQALECALAPLVYVTRETQRMAETASGQRYATAEVAARRRSP